MSNKDLPPSKKRLEKARREGQVCKSTFLTQISVVTIGIITIFCALCFIWLHQRMLLKFVYISGFADPVHILKKIILLSLFSIVACLIPCAFVGAAVEGAQLGFRILIGSGFNKTGKLSVTSGVKKIWSGITGLWLQLFFITFLCVVLFWFLKSHVFQLAELSRYKVFALPAGIQLVKEGGFVLLIWSVIAVSIEYAVKRRQHKRTLMMSAEELKREFKESEGDPHIRAQRKMVYHALVMQDLEQRVRRAKVIIVERSKKSSSF